MGQSTLRPVVVSILLAASVSLPIAARELTFDERVEAQGAIERVYYSHQVGTTLPFEQAVPRELLERKVRIYLEQSFALEHLWKTRIDTEALEHELARIASRTQFPDRLLEVYEALGRDPRVVLECLVRPVLADRLARSFLSLDRELQAGPRREAEALHEALRSGQLGIRDAHPRRDVAELVLRTADKDEDDAAGPASLTPEEFAAWRARAPRDVGEIGPMIETTDAFVAQVVLREEPGHVWLAAYRVPKLAWGEWSTSHREELEVGAVASATDPVATLPQPQAARGSTCTPPNTWDGGILDDVGCIRGSTTRRPGPAT